MAVLDRVPVDRIVVEARDVQVGRTLLALFLGVFYVIGWLVGRLSVGVAYGWASVKLGWRDARKPAGSARGSS